MLGGTCAVTRQNDTQEQPDIEISQKAGSRSTLASQPFFSCLPCTANITRAMQLLINSKMGNMLIAEVKNDGGELN